MVNKLGNALRRIAVARDYKMTRMTLFVYFWNGVKVSWLRRVFFKILCCLVINHIILACSPCFLRIFTNGMRWSIMIELSNSWNVHPHFHINYSKYHLYFRCKQGHFMKYLLLHCPCQRCMKLSKQPVYR